MSTSNPTASTQSALKEQLREFIQENLAQPQGISSFTDEEPLMETGVIDSLGIFRLVSFMEDQLGVRVSDEEINPTTLKNLNSIEELVMRKRKI